MKSKQQWSWNFQEDDIWGHGTFDSREEAIEDALNYINSLENDVTNFYIGKCKIVPLSTNVDAERILEQLDDDYQSETGCDYFVYEDVTDEQIKWLEDKMAELMLEFYKRFDLKSNWFEVTEIEEIKLGE